MAAVLAVVAMLAPLGAVLAAKQAAAGAADSAALAAAEVAVGIVPGAPCELAALVAQSNGATLSRCQVDGAVVTVRATTRVGVGALGFDVPSTATAGPPAATTK